PIPEKWALNFFTMWGGQAVSLIGSSLVQFALVWWMTKTTGSATVLATATLIATLPRILLQPFAGALVDRWNRKVVMIVADSIIALATLVLMFLFAIGQESVLAVYVIVLVRAAGGAFHSPAESACIVLMVPKAHLARIAGLNQTLSGTLNIVSPPLGALLISILPIQAVLAIDVGTAIIAVSILAFTTIPQPPRQVAQANGTAKKTSFREDLREGWSYLIAWRGLVGVVLISMAINFLLVPAFSLIPLMVMQEYQGNALQLGLVNSLFGIGVIIGGLVLAAWGGFKKRILTSMLGVIGIGVGILLFGLLPSNLFYLALVGMFLLGFMQVLSNGPVDALLQAAVAPDMQGRVFSLLNASASAMAPLSLLVAGPVSDWLGVRTWYLLGGFACIIMASIAFFIPAIMNIEEDRQKKLIEA
ncbi:MAG TPA: MFS transporter, partial [Anaerolineaceae bacterium]|nr:MFS transporter [Anaerolineaceae bacterium]